MTGSAQHRGRRWEPRKATPVGMTPGGVRDQDEKLCEPER